MHYSLIHRGDTWRKLQARTPCHTPPNGQCCVVSQNEGQGSASFSHFLRAAEAEFGVGSCSERLKQMAARDGQSMHQ